MCTDSHLPAAPDSAIRVAIIHPLSDPSFHARLSLSNGPGDGTTTTTTLQSADDAAGVSLNVRIQYVFSRLHAAYDMTFFGDGFELELSGQSAVPSPILLALYELSVRKYGAPLSLSPSLSSRSSRSSRTSTGTSFTSGSEPDSDTFDSDSDNDTDADADSSNPIVHSFPVTVSTTTSTTTKNAPRACSGIRLDLGVGGEGVVGRTVSIMDRRSGKILGEGIIGWS
ncbi:hypothetical protein CLCR_05038 [Cladophialophora carrionii]|uniref:Uncharacterized protein n=1 Tax=Cladophialophora carrionii TaxID=86049 RepID=A0A1C1CKE1_9EURO|nr:hypothetical protein CLCR_05038 [Cladophialophora carrionii]